MDIFGAFLDNTDDNYELHFMGPGSLTTGEFYRTAVYQSLGAYLVEFVPLIAGEYSCTVQLYGIDINGSPFSAIVYPGEVKASLCYTTITPGELSSIKAGFTYYFT
jgi:hypothetical protein